MMEITLRNPLKKEDTLELYIEIEENNFTNRWLTALKSNLKDNLHLEKNYCWLGWAESQRNVEYLCDEINKAISQINQFNQTGEWQKQGLKDYAIDDVFTTKLVINNGEIGKWKPGLTLNHDPMNRLHRYFEDLQGEVWELSKYYKYADYDTKHAIRQLNDLCHELESWALSYRKKHYEPEWQRPSQITTFLNAPRYKLSDDDYKLFLKNNYDRVLGGVYLHWAQIGKTQFEVFRDENGADVDATVCSAMNSLKFYSGEFDVEWGNSVTEDNHEWHREEQKKFREWLNNNNFDTSDPKLSLGYIKLGQVNLQKSFGTDNFFDILDIMSDHLDIYKIKIGDVEQIYDYVWSDDNYKQMQIDFLRPGYDWSKNNV